MDRGFARAWWKCLREQNLRLSPGEELDAATARNLERLGDGAVAIVTGQQVGAFYRAGVTACIKRSRPFACADELTKRGGEAVPVFWLATEDHDLAEINHASWTTRDGPRRIYFARK